MESLLELLYLSYALLSDHQGQSVKHVGLDLHVPVFSHGQLYVALSHCTSKDHIKILLPAEANGQTPNIVYHEVLNGIVNGVMNALFGFIVHSLLSSLSLSYCI